MPLMLSPTLYLDVQITCLLTWPSGSDKYPGSLPSHICSASHPPAFQYIAPDHANTSPGTPVVLSSTRDPLSAAAVYQPHEVLPVPWHTRSDPPRQR